MLRDLGLSGNPVLNVADAAGPLETALRNAQDATKLFIGEVLAYVPARSSQQALFDAAGVRVSDSAVALLVGRTAGWGAGRRVAAGPPRVEPPVGRQHLFVSAVRPDGSDGSRAGRRGAVPRRALRT